MIDNTQQPLWEPETLAAAWPEKVVAVCFYGRSGSYFLQSLLDSHPRVMTIFGNLYTFFHEFWNAHQELDRDKLIIAFCQYYAFIFDGRNQCQADASGHLDKMGANEDQKVGVDPILFLDALHAILDTVENLTRRKLFQAVHMAFHLALGRPLIPNPLIVYQLHNPKDARTSAMIEDFPDTLFLHMIREPLQSMNSHFRVYYEQNPRAMSFKSCAWVVQGILAGGRAIIPSYQVRSRAVRLEDLKEDPRGSMERICRWIGIEWHDSLLHSTVNGEQYWFSGSEGKRLKGFEKEHLKQKRSRYFTRFDQFRFDLLLAKKRRHWGYPTPFWSTWNWLRHVAFVLMFFSFRLERLVWCSSDTGAFEEWWMFRGIILDAWRDQFSLYANEIPLLEAAPQPGFQQAQNIVGNRIVSGVNLSSGQRDLVEAERQLTIALQQFPRLPQVYTKLSLVLMARNRMQEAREVVEKGMSLLPDSPEIHADRGFIRLQERDLAGAEEDFRHSIEKSKGRFYNSLVYLGGDICMRTNRLEEGKALLRSAVTTDASQAQAWAFLALAAYQTSDQRTFSTARRMLQTIQPDHEVMLWLQSKNLA
ncbi:MAG: sulfotransferase [Magnetococcales bacterium]|nr:sulfotransferase [Magnetococcales bacterium]